MATLPPAPPEGVARLHEQIAGEGSHQEVDRRQNAGAQGNVLLAHLVLDERVAVRIDGIHAKPEDEAKRRQKPGRGGREIRRDGEDRADDQRHQQIELAADAVRDIAGRRAADDAADAEQADDGARGGELHVMRSPEERREQTEERVEAEPVDRHHDGDADIPRHQDPPQPLQRDRPGGAVGADVVPAERDPDERRTDQARDGED